MNENNSLISRNVNIKGRRTSLRMEEEIWDALEEICDREDKTTHEICSMVEEKRKVANRTSAVRAFILSYFRLAATNSGHIKAGHGVAG